MKAITELIRFFTYITTGIVLVFIVILLFNGYDGISTKMLIEIPCAGLAASLVTVFLAPEETKTKREYHIRLAVHYAALCLLMVILGTSFGWVSFNAAGVVTMIVSTAGVYLFTFAVTYMTTKREAEELNDALRNRTDER